MTDTDPTADVDTAIKALQVAQELLADTNDNPSPTASGALAALLYAASPTGNAGGISWTRQVLAMPGPDSIAAVTAVLANLPQDRCTIYLQSAWDRAITIHPPRARELRAEICAALAPHTGVPA
ncbi:hypothetical protein FZI85_27355 [Mycobacterium sp. CBMA293]|uniref:Uncharacterized protein n=1 Tax=Mycolicibacterium sp. CBMA 213 TaxID=1968788 RepID=A0A1S6GKL7_9MYCO|nr:MULTISPECIES: hypothetical protein [unclassified Mycolicibacterium]AQS22408.1 hypothetical protein pCBMA213_2_00044 [Mycolicibacterium sp. CBMA 213]MUL48466.1 hypothetical protein [Mycolicibacterium sp. CBMA 360]MUL62324.1 hypothetical protein [Mycolicibacterium sp. CBMA 335]MUM04461.1 hypothetical protein [Mycolicibacterium sp. CBMA 213]MUM14724.1 hypothetical protein [Mycolicibacterium sp. CBMA 293]